MIEALETEILIRQAKEITTASMLQACMLPGQAPDHPELELAAFTRPATEIGGDYYDFSPREDGSLTLAIGDATGHGMPAGLVVTATKALFLALADEPSLTGTLQRITGILKRMRLCGHYMSLTLARYEEGMLRFSAAGMPFPLVYRAATRRVERVELRGMPLGSFVDFPYREEQIRLAPGDTVLLTSDGIVELFNEVGEQFGNERVEALLAAVGWEEPQAIIDRFNEQVERWTRGGNPHDDMTFVVLKRRAA